MVLKYIREVVKNWDDRAFWYLAMERKILKNFFKYDSKFGVNIMESDWDTLIILDACRYDVFKENKPAEWPEPLPVRSRASNTWNFYERNFKDDYPDTVVVTANPRTVKIRPNRFHNIIKVYESHWDDDLGTVNPRDMAECTIEAHENYPNKRIISHWIQPHYPFVGSDMVNHNFEGDTPFDELKRKNTNVDQVWEAYIKSFNYTTEYVDKVLNNASVNGKVVVTSDHGNAFEEGPKKWPFPIYGHPRDIHSKELITVPWAEFEYGPRREILEDRTKSVQNNEQVRNQLKSLGYSE